MIANTDTDTRTLREWAEATGHKSDSVQKKYRRKYGHGISTSTVLSVSEWESLLSGRTAGHLSVRKREKKEKRVSLPPEPAENVPPVREPQPLPKKTFRQHLEAFRMAALDAILVGIVIGHAGLIWYDCAIQWGVPGTIGGGIAFAIVGASLLLATDETRVRTSSFALWFVLLVDVAAWFVHVPTFQNAGVPDEMTWAFAAFLCVTSWVALYLYRDKNID